MTSFIEAVKQEYPEKQVFTRPELSAVAEKYSLRKSFTEFMTNESNKIRRGLYKIEATVELSESIVNLVKFKPVEKIRIPQSPILEKKTEKIENLNLIPEKDSEFVPFGDFKLVKKVVSSKAFFPIYISGESGNGKTKMVYEVCAQSKRELIRANITESTDEDDLIG